MSTAILIDGAYFINRVRHFEPHNYFNAQRIADLAIRCAMLHLSDKKRANEKTVRKELYRIFFYDCPPIAKKCITLLQKKLSIFQNLMKPYLDLNYIKNYLKKEN